MRRNTKKKAFQCDILDIISLYHLSSDVLPALDSSDDEDDVPLVNLLKKTKDQKQCEQTAGQSLSSEGQTQDDGRWNKIPTIPVPDNTLFTLCLSLDCI